MTEIIDGIRHLITPVTAEDISALHIGDMFYLSGSMTTRALRDHWSELEWS